MENLTVRYHANTYNNAPMPTATATISGAAKIAEVAWALAKVPSLLEVGTEIILSLYLHLGPVRLKQAFLTAGLDDETASKLLDDLESDPAN